MDNLNPSLKLHGILQVALVIPVPALISLLILKDALSFIVCEYISRKVACLIAEKAQATAYVSGITQIPWFVFKKTQRLYWYLP